MHSSYSHYIKFKQVFYNMFVQQREFVESLEHLCVQTLHKVIRSPLWCYPEIQQVRSSQEKLVASANEGI